ncbi:hypothetical protein SeMB42_g03395 [Synchytrium endobioticum]|uniref:DUF155 domain-containing protein n=1 Tax=Synchytrium endobioticum TaxID=286115 RepID=A0A507CSB3_9FUNG|nr:hypothetical protein SeLEV6574_g05776 [Synchytrium endobioticum]TPX47249.1 hypothetical protein SeMB42_g03395 [Synchytrium endobioticum]
MAQRRAPFAKQQSEPDVTAAGPRPQQANQPRLPKRTTKTAEKGLTLDTNQDEYTDYAVGGNESTQPIGDADSAPFTTYNPFRSDNHLLTSKVNRQFLPRVTAYCSAASYNLEKLQIVFDGLRATDTTPQTKRYDEALYSPFDPSRLPTSPASSQQQSSPESVLPSPASPIIAPSMSVSSLIQVPLVEPTDIDGVLAAADANGINVVTPMNLMLPEQATPVLPFYAEDQHLVDARDSFFEQNVDSTGAPLPPSIPMEGIAKRIAPVGELFLFDYGVVVCWGLSEKEEKAVLDLIRPYETESVKSDEIEKEDFVFFYNVRAPPQIYNDIITLRKPSNVKHKLAISHAIAQSTKLTVYEYLVEDTIESTKSIPETMALTGRIHMSRSQVNRKIGSLFAMRINVNLVGNVLDAPELLWSEPSLEPLYKAIRLYLEITQRVDLLNQRVQVISDLLEVLKDNMTSSHDENLEWIVIILIATEIVLGVLQILLDIYYTEQ